VPKIAAEPMGEEKKEACSQKKKLILKQLNKKTGGELEALRRALWVTFWWHYGAHPCSLPSSGTNRIIMPLAH
jgi:hypothetical protein